ncbi:DUF6884 domain-containing protein [Halorhabdus salina]|uniref:DUF6884 domain-containing protein n=1 Tax=Halorhabdus salina TaxID=2750670 RepID=UPI0015EF3CB7|nr:DUF6884 domain-containing protein [Halorhabdus salina]
MTQEIGLVSCVKSKRDESTVPKDLYTSAYFEKMRSYAEQHHDGWYILSAKHGLIEPDGDPIEPYERTLANASIEEKREWADNVFNELDERGVLTDGVRLVIHAGRDYYGELLPRLEDTDVTVEIPTEGMRIGEKLSWYNERS